MNTIVAMVAYSSVKNGLRFGFLSTTGVSATCSDGALRALTGLGGGGFSRASIRCLSNLDLDRRSSDAEPSMTACQYLVNIKYYPSALDSGVENSPNRSTCMRLKSGFDVLGFRTRTDDA